VHFLFDVTAPPLSDGNFDDTAALAEAVRLSW